MGLSPYIQKQIRAAKGHRCTADTIDELVEEVRRSERAGLARRLHQLADDFDAELQAEFAAPVQMPPDVPPVEPVPARTPWYTHLKRGWRAL